MDMQFACPRDAVAAADDLQYMFATASSSNRSSSNSNKIRPCKVLLKSRTFSGFAAAVTANETTTVSNGSSTVTAASEVMYTINCLCFDE
jgi:hypothetical protein